MNKVNDAYRLLNQAQQLFDEPRHEIIREKILEILDVIWWELTDAERDQPLPSKLNAASVHADEHRKLREQVWVCPTCNDPECV